MIELRALGTAEIQTGSATLRPSQNVAFAAALYLIIERGKPVSRTRLESLLWPEAGRKEQNHRLRQTLYQLKTFGFTTGSDRSSVELSRDSVTTDFDALGTAAVAETDTPLEFLPGYAPRLSDRFEEWLDSVRENVHSAITRRLISEINAARARTDWVKCDRLATTCLALDPLNETAVLAQAEACAMMGAKSRALKLLDRYVTELGTSEPSLKIPPQVLRRRISERIPDPEAGAQPREIEFIGRDREMEELTRKVIAAVSGRGEVCIVIGDAGIGKSRLASEVTRFAILEGMRTVKTVCRRSDVDRPFSAFADLVPNLISLPGALGCSEETLTTLRRLTDFDARLTEKASIQESANSKLRVQAALLDLLDAVADEQPILVTIEDIQWLDPTSLGLLRQLTAWVSAKRALFVLTERRDNNASIRVLGNMDGYALSLGPLATEHARALVVQLLTKRSGSIAPNLVSRLLLLGEGNPFFLQELANGSLESGAKDLFPPSLTKIVDDRIGRLSKKARYVLQACAVLGTNASIDRIEAMLQYKAHALLSAVQELSIAGMLRKDADSAGNCNNDLMVRHDLLATAALSSLGPESLALLHRRAGVVLESETHGTDARTSLLWACAYHWQNAGDKERAFNAALSCGDHLLDIGLTQDAVSAYENSQSYSVTDEQRFRTYSRLALALQRNGQWERSKQVLRAAQQLRAATRPNATTHDDVEFALFEAQWRVSFENAALLTNLKHCAASRDASVTHRVSCGLLGLKVASELSRQDAMRDLFSLIRPLFEEQAVTTITKLEIEMVYESSCGEIDAGVRAAEQLLRIVRSEPNPVVLSRALGNVGIALRLAGRKDDAEVVLVEVYDHAKRHGLTNRMCFAALSLCRLYLAAGDRTRAREAMEKVENLAQTDQDLHRAADRQYFLTRLAFEEGKTEEAWEHYQVLSAQCSSTQSPNRRSTAVAVGIRVAIAKRLPAETVEQMLHVLEDIHLQNRSSGWQDYETLSLAMGWKYCGASNRGRELLTKYLTTYRRERWEAPRELRDFLRELDADYAVSATRSTDPLSGVR